MKLLAPASGEVQPIDNQAPDIFSCGMLGEGVAIALTGNKITSPIKGIVTQVPGSAHRILLKADNGLKIAIMLPPANQQLMGLGVKLNVQAGQKIQPGQQLAQFNLQQLQRHNPAEVQKLYLFITNAELIGKVVASQQKVTAAEDIVLTVTAKADSKK